MRTPGAGVGVRALLVAPGVLISPTEGVRTTHTHVSGVTALYIFLMVVIVGTFWRLAAAYASQRPGLAGEIGKAMAVQF